ncbi:MAG: YbaB/EbfC family nucleoid-associated protein [Micromonosporaceae bacterium]
MDLGSAELDQMLSQARKTLESLRSERMPGADARGIGEAADGRVRAVAASPGRLESLELDPRVMRMPSKDLAQQVLTAVNAALNDLAAQAPSAEGMALPDPAELAAAVADIQQQSVRQMAAISQALTAAVRRAKETM